MDIAALVALAFVSSITPGPNNLMLLSSGMTHGIRRTLPHLAGVSLGFCFLLFVISLGLGSVFERYDIFALTLKIAGSAYLLYLAWKIYNTSNIDSSDAAGSPLTFLQAAAFQWVNPKAWVMGTTAASTLLHPDSSVIAGALGLAGGFWLINLPCIATWVGSGAVAGRWVDNARVIRNVNRVLAILLVGTVGLLLA